MEVSLHTRLAVFSEIRGSLGQAMGSLRTQPVEVPRIKSGRHMVEHTVRGDNQEVFEDLLRKD